MSARPLSIRAAAEECPERIALVVEGRAYSYGELARLVSERPPASSPVIVARSELETALRLYQALEEDEVLTLLQESSTEQERGQLATRARHTSLGDGLIVFTSGSSGQPKGVQLSARALLASARASAERLPWRDDDCWLCALPLSHVGGLSILLRCLVDRKRAVLLERFDTGAILEALRTQRVTHLSLVPTMLRRLLDAGLQATAQLRVLLLGGAAASPELLERAAERGLPVTTTYGMSECASQVITGGAPLPGVELRLRDGLLQIRGPMLMEGYLPPDPSGLDEGWFATSDRAELLDDGSVRILGRADDIIITGGENVDPREVEAALEAHPAIHQSYVLGLEDEEWGQRVVALIVLEGRAPLPSLDELAGLGRHRKPKALIPVAALPLLPNGKVDKKRARELARVAMASRDYRPAT